MANVETAIINTSELLLGDNEFEAGVLKDVPGEKTIKAGTFLKRDGDKFAVLQTPASETVVALVPFDVKNEKDSTADVPFRALISGKVRADKVLVGENVATAEQLDMLRSCAIIPIKVSDVSGVK